MEVHKEQRVDGVDIMRTKNAEGIGDDSMWMKNAEGIGDVEMGMWQLGDGHYLGKSSFGEDDEETGLATGTIADDDEFAADFRHFEW